MLWSCGPVCQWRASGVRPGPDQLERRSTCPSPWSWRLRGAKLTAWPWQFVAWATWPIINHLLGSWKSWKRKRTCPPSSQHPPDQGPAPRIDDSELTLPRPPLTTFGKLGRTCSPLFQHPSDQGPAPRLLDGTELSACLSSQQRQRGYADFDRGLFATCVACCLFSLLVLLPLSSFVDVACK